MLGWFEDRDRDMNVMILGAGRGTRLGPLGLSKPKILLDIGGEALLMRHLRYLESQGVERVVINAHHLADEVVRFVNEYNGPLDVIVVVESQLLGTAGGVRNALEHLGREPFVVLYGDVVIDEPLTDLAAAHQTCHAAATLTVYESATTVGKGVVEVDDRGRVLRFVEKNRSGPGLVNAGLYVVDPRLIAMLPAEHPLDFGHDVLPAAVDRGERVFAYRLVAPVVDVGTPEDLERARRFSLNAA
jgi:mannose-1-phosphate guanylyltransferase